MTGNPALIAHLESLFREHGRIPFSRYMEEALYHPEHGYYSGDFERIGARGDFYTAADLDPAMGTLLGNLFDYMSNAMDSFGLVEIGAGKGLLARHVLSHRRFPYIIVERSPAMRRRQEANLSGFDVEWRDDLPSGFQGCVFSNEFFDALPVRRFVRRGGELKEIFVTEGFSEVEGNPEIELDLPLEEGWLTDLSLEARDWTRRIGRTLDRGYHLAIDYGYLSGDFFSRPSGTLMCYHRHRTNENPYTEIGRQDITAHVNFSDLIDVGSEEGLDLAGYTTQMDFLIDLGLLDLMAPLAEAGDVASIRRLQALKTLLLPPMMGERFRVLLQQKGLPPGPVPGFRRTAGAGNKVVSGQPEPEGRS